MSVLSDIFFRISWEAFCNQSVCRSFYPPSVNADSRAQTCSQSNRRTKFQCDSLSAPCIPAAWITLLYFVQDMPSCYSRMRAQCRLWSMPASRRTASCTSVCRAPPSKTSRSVGTHTNAHILTSPAVSEWTRWNLLLRLWLDFTK